MLPPSRSCWTQTGQRPAYARVNNIVQEIWADFGQSPILLVAPDANGVQVPASSSLHIMSIPGDPAPHGSDDLAAVLRPCTGAERKTCARSARTHVCTFNSTLIFF